MMDQLLPDVDIHVRNVQVAERPRLDLLSGHEIGKERDHVAVRQYARNDTGPPDLQNGCDLQRLFHKLLIEHMEIPLTVLGQDEGLARYIIHN